MVSFPRHSKTEGCLGSCRLREESPYFNGGSMSRMAIAWGVHQLGSAITPEALRNDDDASPVPLLHLRFLLN